MLNTPILASSSIYIEHLSVELKCYYFVLLGARACDRGNFEREKKWKVEIVSSMEKSVLYALGSKTYLQRCRRGFYIFLFNLNFHISVYLLLLTISMPFWHPNWLLLNRHFCLIIKLTRNFNHRWVFYYLSTFSLLRYNLKPVRNYKCSFWIESLKLKINFILN
jgi:hypothetical protein